MMHHRLYYVIPYSLFFVVVKLRSRRSKDEDLDLIIIIIIVYIFVSDGNILENVIIHL